MPDAISRTARVTTTRELALRLLAGQCLSRCAGGDWLIGDDQVPVAPEVFARLRTGFRLVPGGDGLPGFGASFAQTMTLEPLHDDAAVRHLLNKAISDAGGISSFARKRHLSKGQVGDAVTQRRDTVAPNIAAALGLLPRTFYVPLRGAAAR
ncbi:hypothetical protein [Pseudoroseomonas ludipueritiae]|uniref:Transcriptional regulator n=1 Tax=Pseudoroseomonas ludipueritiae TaxID=198093 RepID=A0ABR7R7P0_9PROT|nr:hypothetical protein [Pseudoroseomonas ludipueritiae]MBC9177819.1 hypothetical protein [Pseudoroseomonas ludipueritiae]MCG7363163.1 hypothetical protein [Roseomonas sp. ACRSG]